jgi:hypothetical protein
MSSNVYYCEDCDKVLKNYFCMWRHKQTKAHILKLYQNNQNNQTNQMIINTNNICKYCKKKFSDYRNRWRHENKYCKSIIVSKYKELSSDKTLIKIEPYNESKNTENTENKDNHENTENMENKENTENTENMENKENTENTENTENKVNKKCKHSYIYLIEKYDVNNEEPIYKFGKSNRPINQRLNEHGKEAKIIFVMEVDDCNQTEKKILKILKSDIHIINKKHIGIEYFYCKNKNYIKNLILINILNLLN